LASIKGCKEGEKGWGDHNRLRGKEKSEDVIAAAFRGVSRYLSAKREPSRKPEFLLGSVEERGVCPWKIGSATEERKKRKTRKMIFPRVQAKGER